MPEALARMRYDAVLSRPARGTKRSRSAFVLGLLRRALPTRARGYAGAGLAAVMAGIVLNALTLQHARHPSPFFPPSPPSPPVAAQKRTEPAAPAVAAQKPADPAPASSAPEPAVAAAPEPPARPVRLGAREPVSSQRADPIGDILRGRASRDSPRLIAAAQNALAKLGYAVKPGADMAAALHDFERAHGLPLSSVVTPHLVKLLDAAATSAAAR